MVKFSTLRCITEILSSHAIKEDDILKRGICFINVVLLVLMLALGYGFFRIVNSFVLGQARKLEALLREVVTQSPNTSLERTREG